MAIAVLDTSVREELLARLPPCGCPTCTDSQCQVRPWHCHRPGCAERVASARNTHKASGRVAGHPLMYCSRKCGGAVKKGQLGAAALELLAQAGACGCPSCSDANCAVPHGHCHRAGCESLAAIAAYSSARNRWVAGRPKPYCSRKCASDGNESRKANVAEAARARHAKLRERLLAQAGACGCPACADQVCEVPHGQCHYPGCEERAAIAAQTQTNGRKSRTAYPVVRGEPTLCCPRHMMWKVTAMREVRGRGLLLGVDVAERLLDGTVSRYVRDGRLPVAERVHGLTVFRPDDADRLMRQLARTRRQWEDPSFAAQFMERRWFDSLAKTQGVQFALERRDQAMARAVERRRLRAVRRSTGRPRKDDVREELLAIVRGLVDDGETDGLLGQVALIAWQRGIDDLRQRYPAGTGPRDDRDTWARSWGDVPVDRVRKLIGADTKALLIARTKTPA